MTESDIAQGMESRSKTPRTKMTPEERKAKRAAAARAAYHKKKEEAGASASSSRDANRTPDTKTPEHVKEAKRVYARKHYAQFSDAIKAKKRESYAERKDIINAKKQEKHSCPICYGTYTTNHRSTHMKSARHLRAVQARQALENAPH